MGNREKSTGGTGSAGDGESKNNGRAGATGGGGPAEGVAGLGGISAAPAAVDSVRNHQQVVMKHVLDQDLRMDLAGRSEYILFLKHKITYDD